MAKKIENMDELRPNLFDAVKRAFIFKRGVIHRPKPAAAETTPPASSSSSTSSDTKEKDSKKDESYPERVSDGGSDEEIEKENSKDKLKSQVEGSKTATGPEDLVELTEKSQDVLYEAETVWPFTLFPDTITLDREKLTIANR